MSFARPRTTNERKCSQIDDNILDAKAMGFNIKPRAKRNFVNLPNEYDDKPRSCRPRSWKNHRRTAWKAK